MKKWQSILLVLLGIHTVCLTLQMTGLLDRWEESEIRSHLSDSINRLIDLKISGLKTSKDVPLTNVQSMTAINGESYLSIALELTEQQKQEAIEQVKNNPNWRFKFDPFCLTETEKENYRHSGAAGYVFQQVKNTYSYSNSNPKTESSSSRTALLCPFKNSLIIQSFD